MCPFVINFNGVKPNESHLVSPFVLLKTVAPSSNSKTSDGSSKSNSNSRMMFTEHDFSSENEKPSHWLPSARQCHAQCAWVIVWMFLIVPNVFNFLFCLVASKKLDLAWKPLGNAKILNTIMAAAAVRCILTLAGIGQIKPRRVHWFLSYFFSDHLFPRNFAKFVLQMFLITLMLYHCFRIR